MADWHFDAVTAGELDGKLRGEILALDNLGRGDEIRGTVHVTYSDESVKQAILIPLLQGRGVVFDWKRIAAVGEAEMLPRIGEVVNLPDGASAKIFTVHKEVGVIEYIYKGRTRQVQFQNLVLHSENPRTWNIAPDR
jgi:hypothetical protein